MTQIILYHNCIINHWTESMRYNFNKLLFLLIPDYEHSKNTYSKNQMQVMYNLQLQK
jgi:hypothetical protein